jgi:uridine phosphorylase
MYVIPPSELIINPDGSIYHLHLKPGDLAETIITVGDPDRVKMVSSRFDHVEIEKNHREFLTHTGRFRGIRISVISTGIGTDNIDIVFNETDAVFNVDFEHRRVVDRPVQLHYIRIGTSGTLREDIDVDSMLVSEAALGMDNLMHFYKSTIPEAWSGFFEAFLKEWQYTGIPTSPYFGVADSPLLDLSGPEMVRGVTITAPGFYAPQGRRIRARSYTSFLKDNIMDFEYEGKRFTNFEMESAAMYGLANTLGHKAISFNTILANRLKGEFSSNYEESMGQLVDTVLDLIVRSAGT